MPNTRHPLFLRAGFLVLLACLVLVLPGSVGAQQQQATGFLSRIYKDDAGEHKYVVFVPANYTPQKKLPAILFLHGAGERGNDGLLQTTVGLGPHIQSQKATFPFITVFPQCEDLKGRILTGWLADSPDGSRAIRIFDEVAKEFNIDAERQIITGWSMGGYGTWSMAAAFPTRWSAVAPISGGGDAAWGAALKDLPIWAMHGANDAAVRVTESQKMIEAIRKAGGHPRYTEFPDAEHDVWKLAYGDESLFTWMLAPQTALAGPPLAARPRQRTSPVAAGAPGPFVPELDIPRAVYVRLGNDMLAALADSVPSAVPPDMLRGGLNDISDVSSSSGVTFNVYFSGISYAAQLSRASIKAYAPGRLNVQLGLSNLQITIGSTSLDGGRRGAVAGPVSIVIGHQRPVWLSFDVMPTVVDRKLRLTPLGSSFSIPSDNWYVTPPAGVSTQGLGVTSEKVSSGIVSGLYGSKARIEQQVGSIVPNLIAEMERRLDLSAADKVISGVWPLPVYRPRLRAWPAEVSTDDRGVSIVLGVTAAQVDPQKPRPWTAVAPVGPAVETVPRTTNFHLGVAPAMLGPLSEMLIRADVARIHVLDTPAKSMAQLVDPAIMSEAIPDLRRFGDQVEIWSEIVLASPIRVVDAAQDHLLSQAAQRVTARRVSPDDPRPIAEAIAAPSRDGTSADNQPKQAGKPAVDGQTPENGDESPRSDPPTAAPISGLSFQIPRLKLSVAIRTDPASSKWTPYAEFEVHVRQLAEPQLDKPNSQQRLLSLNWSETARLDVVGRFAPGYEPQDPSINVERFNEIFTRGWEEFTQAGPATRTALPDLDFGYSRLRTTDVAWQAPYLSATFGPAGVTITNNSQVPMVYETKGPYSGWGGPFTLAPGAEHAYPISYPLLYRRKTEHGMQMFTLPAGSNSEFRAYPPNLPLGVYQVREQAAATK